MGFVEGKHLASVIEERGALPVVEVLSIAIQVAHGLAAAHRVGVVHRDLKPSNVMVSPDGTSVIMDLGISRSMSGTNTATALGAVLGTLEDMAPEHARGLPLDPRADIYSFGLIVYDALTGRRRLARRENAMAEMVARMRKAPAPLHDRNPAIPEALASVVARCLEPAPDNRFQRTEELIAALEGLMPDGTAIGGRP